MSSNQRTFYYNALINSAKGNDSSVGQMLAAFAETRAIPILRDTTNWKVGLSRLSTAGATLTLPLWKPEITSPYADKDETPYGFTLNTTWTGNLAGTNVDVETNSILGLSFQYQQETITVTEGSRISVGGGNTSIYAIVGTGTQHPTANKTLVCDVPGNDFYTPDTLAAAVTAAMRKPYAFPLPDYPAGLTDGCACTFNEETGLFSFVLGGSTPYLILTGVNDMMFFESTIEVVPPIQIPAGAYSGPGLVAAINGVIMAQTGVTAFALKFTRASWDPVTAKFSISLGGLGLDGTSNSTTYLTLPYEENGTHTVWLTLGFPASAPIPADVTKYNSNNGQVFEAAACTGLFEMSIGSGPTSVLVNQLGFTQTALYTGTRSDVPLVINGDTPVGTPGNDLLNFIITRNNPFNNVVVSTKNVALKVPAGVYTPRQVAVKVQELMNTITECAGTKVNVASVYGVEEPNLNLSVTLALPPNTTFAISFADTPMDRASIWPTLGYDFTVAGNEYRNGMTTTGDGNMIFGFSSGLFFGNLPPLEAGQYTGAHLAATVMAALRAYKPMVGLNGGVQVDLFRAAVVTFDEATDRFTVMVRDAQTPGYFPYSDPVPPGVVDLTVYGPSVSLNIGMDPQVTGVPLALGWTLLGFPNGTSTYNAEVAKTGNPIGTVPIPASKYLTASRKLRWSPQHLGNPELYYWCNSYRHICYLVNTCLADLKADLDQQFVTWIGRPQVGSIIVKLATPQPTLSWAGDFFTFTFGNAYSAVSAGADVGEGPGYEACEMWQNIPCANWLQFPYSSHYDRDTLTTRGNGATVQIDMRAAIQNDTILDPSTGLPLPTTSYVSQEYNSTANWTPYLGLSIVSSGIPATAEMSGMSIVSPNSVIPVVGDSSRTILFDMDLTGDTAHAYTTGISYSPTVMRFASLMGASLQAIDFAVYLKRRDGYFEPWNIPTYGCIDLKLMFQYDDDAAMATD